MSKYFFMILYIGIILAITPSCELSPISTPVLINHIALTNTSTNISTNIYNNSVSTTNTIINVVTNIITNMIKDLFDDPITNICLVEDFFPQKEVVYQKIYGEKPNILYENFYFYENGKIGIIQSIIQDNICSVAGFMGKRKSIPLVSVSIKQKDCFLSIDKSLYSNYVVVIVVFDRDSPILGISRGENIIEFPYLMKIESSSLKVIPLIDLGFFYQIVGDEKVFSRIL